MNRYLVAATLSVLALVFLSHIHAETGVGETLLLQGAGGNTVQECISLSSQFGGGNIQHRCAMLDELNQFRVRHGVRPLRVHPFLMKSAQWWSGVQAFHGEGGHPEAVNQRYLKNYRDPVKRQKAFCSNNQNTGATPTSLGINSAARQEIYAWEQSSGHNENQLNPGWQYFGSGLAQGPCSPELKRANNSPNAQCYYSTVDFGG
ncbi:hypothetical protein CL622_02980 [archaeon]|nr:hypothetical protein [archaeon]